MVDFLGISLYISGCLVSSIYFGYYCDPFWQQLYVSLCAIFCLITTGVSNLPIFLLPSNKKYKIGLFFVHISFCIIPLIHWIIRQGPESDIVDKMLWRILAMFGIFGIGFVFYATKIPERLSPGTFDIVFSSHQWWHLITIIAAYWQHQTTLFFCDYKLKYGCQSTQF